MKLKITLTVCSIMILTACVFGTNGSGNVTTETRTLEKFTGIQLKSVANVYITQGEKQEVKIEAEDNLLKHIITEIKNDELIIDCEENIHFNSQVNVYITTPDLNLLELSGSGNMMTKNTINSSRLTLRLDGSGEMKVAMKSETLKTSLSGSGNLDMKGSAAESTIRISGSGNVNAQELKTFTSSVSISGSGNSKVDVNNELNVNITGSGNVLYVTEPAKITTKITGTGEVQKI